MTSTGIWPGMSIWTKKNQKLRPGLPHDGHTTGFLTGNRGGFSFDGHRLSSLYRILIQGALRLMPGYFPASSLQKYSNLAAPRVPAVRRAR